MANPTLPSQEEFEALSLREQKQVLIDNAVDKPDSAYKALLASYNNAAFTGDPTGITNDQTVEMLVQARAGEKKTLDKKLDKTADQRIAIAAQGGKIDRDLDGDGEVSDTERQALDRRTAKAAEAQAAASGRPAVEAKAQLEAAMGLASLGSTNVPEWIMSMLGGRVPSSAEVQQIMSTYNAATGQAESFGSTTGSEQDFGGLNRLATPTPENQEIVEAALYGRDPIVTKSYKTRGADGLLRDVIIDDNRLKTIQGLFGANDEYDGLDDYGLGALTRTAARSGLMTSAGDVGWQPLVALTKAAGVSMTVKSGQYGSADAAERGAGSRVSEATKLSMRYQEGMRSYGQDGTMAYLHALDPALAMRLYAGYQSGEGKVSPDDRNRANQLLVKGGWSAKGMETLGYYVPGSTEGLLNDGGALYEAASAGRGGGGGGGGGGRVRVMPDPEKVKQAVTDVFRNLFMTDPTAEQISAFSGELNKIVASTPFNEDVDVEAKMTKFAQDQPIYQDLYGKRPNGMAEADYMRQFQAASATMLGNEATNNTETIKAGMRSGKYQSTIGATAGSAQAWNNSTFLGRMAQAAQSVNEMT